MTTPNVFDFSNLQKDHPLFSETNRNRVGYWKLQHNLVQEFVAMRPTNYSIRFGGQYKSVIKLQVFLRLLHILLKDTQIRTRVQNFCSRRVRMESGCLNEKGALVIKFEKISTTLIDVRRVWCTPALSRAFGCATSPDLSTAQQFAIYDLAWNVTSDFYISYHFCWLDWILSAWHRHPEKIKLLAFGNEKKNKSLTCTGGNYWVG